MADHTSIEWTDATWQPITGCSVISPGCTNCYAMKLAGTRLAHHPSRAGLTRDSKAGPVWTGEVRLNEEWLTQPLRWKKPRKIFVCAHGDLFHESVPDEWIDRVFAVMALTRKHTYQVLTKRSERMREYIARTGRSIEFLETHARDLGWTLKFEGAGLVNWPLSNVWLGVSCEDQQRYDERKDDLRNTPAAVRFFSFEPLLGPIVADFLGDWGIVGGESGPNARPMHPDWARSLRDQCQAAGTAYFFKQWGEWLPWEPEHGPCWISQNGRSEDAHVLFPVDLDSDPRWDDGLWAGDGGVGHAAFQRVGKKRAGRLLDGKEWNEFPNTMEVT